MEIDDRAPLRESAEVVIDAPPEVVWDTLSDLRSWPRWMPGVKAVRVAEPVGVGTEFQWKAGPSAITSEILDYDRPRSLGWKGRTLGISGFTCGRIKWDAGGSHVLTEESWAILCLACCPGWSKSVRKALHDDSRP